MPVNPFLDYLSTHPDADAGALKELYRILAKRTHPDLGAPGDASFVRLQECYHEALSLVLERDASARPASGERYAQRRRPSDGAESGPREPSPRDRLFLELYRYTSRLPSNTLEVRPLPAACTEAFAAAREAAGSYDARAAAALDAFHEQFHARRAEVARYPDVRTKYLCLMRALASFFDVQLRPTEFNLRVVRSYLADLGPVTDVDPSASPLMRSNRSAAARSALYRMRTWLEEELAGKPADPTEKA